MGGELRELREIITHFTISLWRAMNAGLLEAICQAPTTKLPSNLYSCLSFGICSLDVRLESEYVQEKYDPQ